MANKYWQEVRKLNILGKLRNTITLPAFAVRSGENNGSAFFKPSVANGFVKTAYTDNTFKTAFSFECWYKTSSSHATLGTIFENVRVNSGGFNIRVSVLDDKIVVKVLKGAAVSTLTSASSYYFAEWAHLCVTYDGTTVKIYQNGVQDTNTLAVAANLDADSGPQYILRFATGAASAFVFNGYLSEIRLWSIALTQGQIDFYKNRRRGLSASLSHYIRFNSSQTQVAAGTLYDYITGTLDYSSLFEDVMIDDEEYPTLIQGASCLAGIFDVILDQKVSLKYPCRIPANADFMLCVSYVDEDTGLTVRYRLWDMDGISLAVMPNRYRGEVLPEVIRFEIWGVDGVESCTMASTYVIHFSKCSLPTTSRDTTQVALVTAPTLDNTIAAAWPLTFPQSFIEEQHGTVAVPVASDISVMSSSLTNYGSIQ
jgi:hypothetical protein